MEAAFAALESSGIAAYLRSARWGYAAVNAAHILGVALLIGAIMPLNLRLLGLWRGVDRAALVRVLAPMAAAGLVLAGVFGFLLFSVGAASYAALEVFRIKLALILVGTLSALFAHWRYGLLLDKAGRQPAATHAVFSIGCWLGALACGRLIAFLD